MPSLFLEVEYYCLHGPALLLHLSCFMILIIAAIYRTVMCKGLSVDYLIYSSQLPTWVSLAIIPILQNKKLQLEKAK